MSFENHWKGQLAQLEKNFLIHLFLVWSEDLTDGILSSLSFFSNAHEMPETTDVSLFELVEQPYLVCSSFHNNLR